MTRIIITEEQEKALAAYIKSNSDRLPVDRKANKPYSISPEKVLIVKNFLDRGFTPHDYEKIGDDGYPVKIKIVSMNAENGTPLKYMYKEQLKDLLIDRFQKMFSDTVERDIFMGRILDEWLNGTISPLGLLTTNRLVSENVSKEEIDAAANKANTSPTEKQKEAGNYKMGHIRLYGMPISIENPKGSKRVYKKEDGTTGYNIMKAHYGYFKLTDGKGKDGDAVDVFVGPYYDKYDKIFVVDQNAKDGSFDESKVMIGYRDIDSAKNAYMSNYGKDWKGFRCITGVPITVFKDWLYRGRKQRKPFAEYAKIQQKQINESTIKEEEYNQKVMIVKLPNESLAKKYAKEIYYDGIDAYNEGNIVYADIEIDINDPKYIDDVLHYYRSRAFDFLKDYISPSKLNENFYRKMVEK